MYEGCSGLLAKKGLFWEHLCTARALWLAGGTGETSKRYLVFTANIANDGCEAIQAHHAPDCRIILDGKVDNLV